MVMKDVVGSAAAKDWHGFWKMITNVNYDARLIKPQLRSLWPIAARNGMFALLQKRMQ